VLTLSISNADERVVRNQLASMYVEFPHLEAKVKAGRKPTKGLFAPVAAMEPFRPMLAKAGLLK